MFTDNESSGSSFFTFNGVMNMFFYGYNATYVMIWHHLIAWDLLAGMHPYS